MEFTKEQKNYLADVYANGKSSSDVFREQHKADFIAGFEKALSLFAVSDNSAVNRCNECSKELENKMTEEQIKELGWKLVKQYNHDQYNTNRYKLGCMEIEFTYEGKELLTCDVTISELNCMPISFNQAKLLTELLGHWSE